MGIAGLAGRIRKAVSISRPLFWLAPPTAYAAGLALGGTMRGMYESWELLLLSFPLSFFLYAINDIYDLKSDKANARKGGAWGARLDEADVPWVEKTAFFFAALIIATALLSMNPLHIFFAVLGILLCYFYSAPPLRLKSKPVVDSLVNGGYGYVAFAFGCSLSGSMLFLNPYVFLATLCVSAIHAITTVMDFEADRKTGEKTFATAYGPRAPAFFAFAAFGISLLVFLNSGYQSPIALAGGCLATLLSLFVLIFPKPENAKLALKALLAFALIVAYYFFLKYIILGQWFGDFSEQELAQVKILWNA